MKKRIEGVTVYGIDIGKNTFHVVGLDSSGKPILHSKFKRDRLLAHFANTPAALIGTESCPGSQWLARKLQASDHTVKIVPAQFVKPYVKSNKNDMVDAAAMMDPFSLIYKVGVNEKVGRKLLTFALSQHCPYLICYQVSRRHLREDSPQRIR